MKKFQESDVSEGDKVGDKFSELESNFSHSRTDYIHVLIGVLLILIALVIFVFFTIWIVISKLEIYEKTSSQIVNFIIEDKHYCLAIPLLLPVTFITFYLRWISFNYFKYC